LVWSTSASWSTLQPSKKTLKLDLQGFSLNFFHHLEEEVNYPPLNLNANDCYLNLAYLVLNLNFVIPQKYCTFVSKTPIFSILSTICLLKPSTPGFQTLMNSFFGGTGVWTQDFVYARQVLYYLSHTSTPFLNSYSLSTLMFFLIEYF
jgi:hypothetical protein